MNIEILKGHSQQMLLMKRRRAALEAMTAGREPNDLMLTRPDGQPWGVQDQKRPMTEA